MLHRFIALALVALLAGCASGPRRPDAQANGVGLLGSIAPFLTSGRPALTDAQSIDPSNVAVRGATDPGASDDPVAEPRGGGGVGQAAGGNYTLNFVNAEIQEFVRSVFDEVLKESVVVAPTLQGRVTVRTQNPVSKAVALDLVREALQVSGASLSRAGQVWRVGAIGSGPGAQPGSGGRARETVRVIPLRHVDSNEARQALQSLAANGSDITISGTGRFVILAGRSVDVDAMDQMLASLDVDQLRGQAFSLVPLKQAGASAVSRDLNGMFGGGESGVRAMPIERMNAVLITTRNRAAMARARAWIANLDQAGRGDRRVHVYPVRNRRAGDLAKVLDGMFRGRSSSARGSSDGGVAPSLTPQRASTGAVGVSVRVASADGAAPQDAQPGANGGSGDERSDAIEIRADLSTNSLVVVSKPEDYRAVEAAIRSLDVVPTQVLIEATIAEVRLNDAVRGGVRWFFQKGNHGFSLTDNAAGSLAPNNPGFNYSFGVANARIVLSALESVTDVEVISSPALTVLDNQSATLKVGDQVPIATRSARSVTNPDAPIVNDIQLKDTGIILSVTPRVNSGGLVMLDIVQEASDVVPTTTSGIDSPTIRQRQVTSSVAVESGAEIVLGGIITRREEKGKSGIPLLKDIPILGAAFTSNNQLERGRTELLIILRPTIMSNSHEIRAVTEEIKARMNAASTGIYRGDRSRGAAPPVVK